jgi:23S rRNA pseudoU1915 N3-methylase RlmH
MTPSPYTLNVLISVFLLPAIVFADDFKTVDGKEYKNATVTRVEADGIVVKTKGGISKVYFAELPKDVQERFHYDPQKAAAAQAADVRQTEELNKANKQTEELDKQRKAATEKQYQQGLELQAKYNNTQALTDQLSVLQRQEQNLLVLIGRAEKAQTDARRRWIDGQGGTQYTAPDEGNLAVLRGNLENVREEKQRVRQELEQAQRQPQR